MNRTHPCPRDSNQNSSTHWPLALQAPSPQRLPPSKLGGRLIRTPPGLPPPKNGNEVTRRRPHQTRGRAKRGPTNTKPPIRKKQGNKRKQARANGKSGREAQTPLLILTTGREGAEPAANRRARRLLPLFPLSIAPSRARARSGGGARGGGSQEARPIGARSAQRSSPWTRNPSS